jgi:hypothetical protein
MLFGSAPGAACSRQVDADRFYRLIIGTTHRIHVTAFRIRETTVTSGKSGHEKRPCPAGQRSRVQC